ncbi:fungal specific transcription factor domain-containing protein [Histoplasma capsulatum G186AR]|uniref:Fungal specific transcription factor domain-containing protein n=2 Tax=Ajellomyces capsulatus TaxID=5037 RepID=C0NKK4_AJECG|nr:fungal specific transcription factor domain-containing protein [Histoplasma capsulatum G186AR]EEH08395.1 fungal specific transcription factor domain-containing protein [Histoplasma capsulatum G186AR]KAG5299294.1 fungal specific transcription factor domain-containing protein [Histoplasma capsulatum]QSS68086.1 fungal specific transcription factor domain-containing protein [Histoplasma capsulatum G186AR]
MATFPAGLETPLLKVSRPVAACSRCRAAKVKCDGKLPACSACERAGKASSCPGATDEFAKGKERSYVASLEGQCERLEKEIAEAKRRRQNSIMERAAMGQNYNSPPIYSQGGKKSYRKETSDINDLVGDFGFLSVNATSRDFYGITSSTSFARLLLAVAVSKPLQNAGVNRGLPARPVSSTLIQHYFDNIYVLAPFFIQTNFWASFDAIYQEGGRFAKSFDYWIVHMVLAISQALTSHSQIARHHVSIALEYADDVLHPGSIAGIQAILLLAQYSMLDPEHFRTWHLIGSAARVVSDLGIHQEQLSEPYLNKTNLDLRRKVFHCVYSFDRYVSIAFGRAFSFSDDSVNVPLPGVPLQPIGEALNWTTPLFAKGIEPAIYLFKIRGIQSKAYQIMFFSGRNPAPEPSLYTWEVCAEAQSWFNAIPRTLPGHLIIFYNAELFFTFVILLSPSNYNPSVSILHRVLLFEYAIKFISQIHQIISAASWPLFFSYIDIQRVYTVASKFIDALDQSYDEILLDTLPELATPVPPGTHQPPYVSPTERIDSNGRALKCLQSIGSILKYAHTRWNMRDLLDEFQRSSIHLEKRLIQTQAHGPQHHVELAPAVAPVSFPGQAYTMHPAQPQYIQLSQQQQQQQKQHPVMANKMPTRDSNE